MILKKTVDFTKNNIHILILEILVIILGISLSLYLNSKVKDKENRKQETEYLSLIKEDFKADLLQLEDNLEVRQKQQEFIEQCLASLLNRVDQPSVEAFVSGLQNIVTTRRFFPNQSSFEALKSTGKLYVFKDKQILSEIIEIIEVEYKHLFTNDNDLSLLRNNYTLPYIMREYSFFENVILEKNTTNVSERLMDRELQNILIYNRISLFSTVSAYQETIVKVKAVIESLDK